MPKVEFMRKIIVDGKEVIERHLIANVPDKTGVFEDELGGEIAVTFLGQIQKEGDQKAIIKTVFGERKVKLPAKGARHQQINPFETLIFSRQQPIPTHREGRQKRAEEWERNMRIMYGWNWKVDAPSNRRRKYNGW